jgi:catalase
MATIAASEAAAEAKTNSISADGKIADMKKDTVEINGKQHMTTDYGIRISDPDHSLRVASDSSTGPSLLEDQIAREKVRISEDVPLSSRKS